MIEKYFLHGIRLKWAFPGDDTKGAKDGSVIDNPKITVPDMIYDGLDDRWVAPKPPDVVKLGFKMGMKIPYQWLVYSVGHTTRKLLAAGDVLTGYMSGCIITMWQDDGLRYVGHIGTSDSDAKVSKLVKAKFAESMPDDACGFNPFAVWTDQEMAAMSKVFKAVPKVLGLVTAKGGFYSILIHQFPVSQRGVGDWCVGGIKHVPPMNPKQLRTALTK
jgi:hypothetical protein